MNFKIMTPLGYVNINDERLVENAKTAFAGLCDNKELGDKKIEDSVVRNGYKIETPFGYICANSYDSIFNSRNAAYKTFGEKKMRNIKFVKIE